MSLPMKLKKFLRQQKVLYEVIVHPEKYTSSETAEAEDVPGKEVAKVVMLRSRNKDVMAVLPASCTIDFLKMSTLLGTQDVRLEQETEFAKLFPDCEAGAMPPFGKLYQLPCYIDKELLDAEHIVFNGGNHKESVRIWAKDFFRVVKGKIADFAVKGKMIAA